MVKFQYGGKAGSRFTLVDRKDMVVVRTCARAPLAETRLTKEGRRILDGLERVAAYNFAGVEVFRCRPRELSRDTARATLKKEPELQFAGRVLAEHESGAPVLYTENLFVKLEDDMAPRTARKRLAARALTVKRELEYARNAYFVGAPEGIGRAVFDVALEVLAEEGVELAHPELVRQVRRREAFPQQWHLKKTSAGGLTVDAHANVEAAWAVSDGRGTVIAVVDDGVDVQHEELSSPGKIVFPWDATRGIDDPRPGTGDRHGMACAGVACADGRFGAAGVAPRARLMPIRLASGLGSQAEADAILWAARNGADVISCSWGPEDGDWSDPADPLHRHVAPLPDSTRLALEWAIRNGRGGKGCVITWAAGNGNESVDNDGYASFEKVIAVAACNDRGRKSAYSDFGKAIWCAFPSNDTVAPTRTPGIWTTDRSGATGYNPGLASRGDTAGNYTNSFGGTSSACPGVAGVAALVLARNPGLRWDEVKDVIKRSCERIDPTGGRYDATGHSDLYGYGRVNALTAVTLAVPAQPSPNVVVTASRDVPIADLATARLSLDVASTTAIRALKVTVDIEHTFIGDLVVRVRPPRTTGPAVVLHQRTGGGTRDLRTTFDAISTPALAALFGRSPKGKWTLEVADEAREDVGRIRSFSVELGF